MAPACRLTGYRQDCPSSLPKPDYYFSVKPAHECNGDPRARAENKLIVLEFNKLMPALCRNSSTSTRFPLNWDQPISWIGTTCGAALKAAQPLYGRSTHDAGGARGATEIHGGSVSGDRATTARRSQSAGDCQSTWELAPDGTRDPRDGLRTAPGRAGASTLWTSQVDWPQVLHELGLGHPLKFICEERAQSLTSYPNFWRQLYRTDPELRQATVTARDFASGERVEVDHAGDPIRPLHIHVARELLDGDRD
jgi:hypothetical protein